MQKSLEKVQALFINKHFDELCAARDRADKVDASGTTLGEGMRLELMAATEAKSIEEIVQGAKLVKKMKRGALIQVHNLLYYANRFGVMICLVPAEFKLGGFNAVWGPSITYAGGPEILKRLGAVETRGVGFDYSNCVEAKADWMD